MFCYQKLTHNENILPLILKIFTVPTVKIFQQMVQRTFMNFKGRQQTHSLRTYIGLTEHLQCARTFTKK